MSSTTNTSDTQPTSEAANMSDTQLSPETANAGDLQPSSGGAHISSAAYPDSKSGANSLRSDHVDKQYGTPVSETTNLAPAFIPVILGGDIGAYALGREFHEAYGCVSICISESPAGVIKNSKIIRYISADVLSPEDVINAIERIHRENSIGDSGNPTILLMTNSEACIPTVLAASEALPYVVTPTPSRSVINQISHKDRFAELCRAHGLDTPAYESVCLAGTEPIAPCSIPFPVVAKPAYSPDYAGYMSQGFKKVYFIQRQEELDKLWSDLRAAGFTGTFVVQELIGGDDTYMDSITLYIDSTGKTTLFGGANVLLEDHAPSMLGNPVAMITKSMPDVWQTCAEMLASVGYRGFANYDIKRNPKDGRMMFLEVNPRIGRNSYYVCAAGVNPMRVCVEDLVFGRSLEPAYATDEILYTLVPLRLLRRYIRDEQLRSQMEKLIRAGKVSDPQRYAKDRKPSRMLDVLLTEWNQIRKFNRYYPEPTDTSF